MKGFHLSREEKLLLAGIALNSAVTVLADQLLRILGSLLFGQ